MFKHLDAISGITGTTGALGFQFLEHVGGAFSQPVMIIDGVTGPMADIFTIISAGVGIVGGTIFIYNQYRHAKYINKKAREIHKDVKKIKEKVV